MKINSMANFDANPYLNAGFYQHKTDSNAIGSVKVYNLNTETWTEYSSALTGSDVVNGDRYGRSVAVWGNYYVIGKFDLTLFFLVCS